MKKIWGDESKQIGGCKDDFRKIVNELRNCKVELNTKVSESLISKFSNEIMSYVERVKSDSKQFKEFSQTVEGFRMEVDGFKQEMEKLKRISSDIKEEDFTLHRYAKKLEQNDREKVRLQKEVENLKRLLARERKK